MDSQEFTWMGAVTVFWAMTWRAVLIAIPVGVVVGCIVGAVSFLIGFDQDVARGYANMGGQIIMFPVYVYVIKRLCTKGFGKYRLAVVEKE